MESRYHIPSTGPQNSAPSVKIDRPAYQQPDFDEIYFYKKPDDPDFSSIVKKNLGNSTKCSPKKTFLSFFPVLKWMQEYNWAEDFVSDIISGFTVAVMHIPQGMAYALLAGVPPIAGIYMAFFPVLVYFLMGTSRHVSMGTFAVVCLLVGKVTALHGTVTDTVSATDIPDVTTTDTPDSSTTNIPDIATTDIPIIGSTVSADSDLTTVLMYKSLYLFGLNNASVTETSVHNTDVPVSYRETTPWQVATALSMIVGFVQMGMGVLRLGALSLVLSDVLVSGFTTGAACHVLTSQIKSLFGVKVPRFNGPFKIIYTYIEFFKGLSDANVAAVTVSAITITVLAINNELIKPRVAKHLRFPIPIELMAVVTGTLASSYGYFNKEYDMNVIGEIPTGLPAPTMPPMWLLPEIAVDGVVIAIVAYSITLSMAKIFAKKLNYEIDANQELLAQGTGNVVGSFFSCAPFAASLSRSLIQQSVGGRTQLASIVSCSLLLVVLLVLGPLFEQLPNCVLSSIIVVALKGMFMQFKDFKKFWNTSKLEGWIWIFTFLAVVILDIDYGLGVGVGLSILSLLYRTQMPQSCLLGEVPNTDIYLDVQRYKGVLEYPRIKIVRFAGGLHFANGELFKSKLYTMVEVNPQKISIRRKKIEAKEKKNQKKKEKNNNSGQDKCESEGGYVGPCTYENEMFDKKTNGDVKSNCDKIPDAQCVVVPDPTLYPEVRHVILDCSCISYVDSMGAKTIRSISQEFEQVDITLFIAGCTGPVAEMMEKCGIFDNIPRTRMFPTVHDAVLYAQCHTGPKRDTSTNICTKL